MWRSRLVPPRPPPIRTPAVRVLEISACVALALLLFAWPLLLDIPLLDPDEGLHASIAQEMLEHHEWITPSFVGQPFLDKPIFYFWAQTVSLAVLGENEAAVRLPSLFFGALGAVATGLLARDLLGTRAGLIAGAMQATMLGPLAQSQAGSHDVALVPWTTFALLWLRHADAATQGMTGQGRHQSVIQPLALTSLFLGLSILTKGLAGVALVMVPAVAILAVERRVTMRRLRCLAACAGVAAVIALPWYVLMEHAHPGYLRYYFVERHLLGFATGTARHAGRPWWYYVPVLLAGGFPWALYLPAAAVRRVWIWLVTGLLFLTVAKVKLWTYALPLFPAIAILAAHAWTRILDDARPNVPRAMRWGVTAHVVAGALSIPAVWLFSRGYGLPSSFALGVCAAVIAAGCVWARSQFARGAFQTAWLALAGVIVATSVAALALVMPTIADSLSARDLARYFNATGTLPVRMLVLDDRIGSFVFYLRQDLRRGLTPGQLVSLPIPALAREIDDAAPGTLVAVRERRAWLVERAFRSCGSVYVRAGQFRLYHAERLQACGD